MSIDTPIPLVSIFKLAFQGRFQLKQALEQRWRRLWQWLGVIGADSPACRAACRATWRSA